MTDTTNMAGVERLREAARQALALLKDVALELQATWGSDEGDDPRILDALSALEAALATAPHRDEVIPAGSAQAEADAITQMFRRYQEEGAFEVSADVVGCGRVRITVEPAAGITPRPTAPANAPTREAVAREDIARVLFDQRQSGHDFEEAAEADVESDAGTLRSICFEDADAILALIPPAAAEVPEGRMLVPREPTDEMLEAATIGHRSDSQDAEIETLWSAMLSAAPNADSTGRG